MWNVAIVESWLYYPTWFSHLPRENLTGARPPFGPGAVHQVSAYLCSLVESLRYMAPWQLSGSGFFGKNGGFLQFFEKWGETEVLESPMFFFLGGAAFVSFFHGKSAANTREITSNDGDGLKDESDKWSELGNLRLAPNKNGGPFGSITPI